MSSLKRVREHRLRRKAIKTYRLLSVADEYISSDECESDTYCEKNLNNDQSKNKDGIILSNNCNEQTDLSEQDYSNKEHEDNENERYSDYNFELDNADEWYQEEDSHSSDDIHTNEELDFKHASDEEPEVNELRQWSVKSRIPHKHLDSLLKILTRRPLLNMPSSSTTFLKTRTARYKIEKMMDAHDLSGEFAYLNIQKGLEACVNPVLHLNNILKLDFHFDAVKIKNASSKSLWVLLCKVYYKNNPSIYKPFPITVFYGHGKPKDISEFFKEFILEINYLLANGVSIKSKQFMIKIRSFIADLPARASAKCIKVHTSKNACERCDIVAHKIDNTTVFISLEGLFMGNNRSNKSFLDFEDVDHHTGVSPLIAIKPQIDFIKLFVIDSMHCLYLGVMPRILENLMSGPLTVRLSANQKTELSRRTQNIKIDIPEEFKRKLRPTDDYDKYKAVDNKFFAQYCGPIVLKKLLPDRTYENFLKFHVAVRMLSSKNAETYVTITRQYLQEFVEESVSIYKSTFVSLNVHNLQHIPDDVLNMKSNLNDISAFPYESELGKIKNLLLSPHHTVAQYCRRIHEQREILNNTAKVPEDITIIKQKMNGITKLSYKGYILTHKHPNNTVLLKSKKVVRILKIFKADENFKVQIQDYKIKKSVFEVPCDSSLLDIYEIESSGNNQPRNISIDLIDCKMIKFSLDFAPNTEKKSFVVPMLH